MNKKSSLSLPLLVLQVVQYLHFVVSQCSTNPVIFNFGDSNSDTGGYVVAHGIDFPYPYGRTFFDRQTGRASDGRLIIDFLCDNVNASYLNHYLDSLEPSFENGVNFAISGAATHPKRALFSLDVQVLQFKRFRRRCVERRSNGLTYSIGEEDFKNALYTIDIGQNDLSYAFGSLSYREAIEIIPSYVSEIRNAMWDIYLLGGRKFWVHNTGPLGCLPRELVLRNNVNATDFDQYGCIISLNDGAEVFNTELYLLCQEMRSLMENSSIVYVDVYSIKYDLIASSTLYGFKNPLMACCGHGGAPYNCDSIITCLDGNGCTVCEEGEPYISWDGTHYTEAANAIVASKILSTRYSSPPCEFNFFCNYERISAS